MPALLIAFFFIFSLYYPVFRGALSIKKYRDNEHFSRLWSQADLSIIIASVRTIITINPIASIPIYIRHVMLRLQRTSSLFWIHQSSLGITALIYALSCNKKGMEET